MAIWRGELSLTEKKVCTSDIRGYIAVDIELLWNHNTCPEILADKLACNGNSVWK